MKTTQCRNANRYLEKLRVKRGLKDKAVWFYMQEYFILRKQYIEVIGPHHLSSARDKLLLFLVNKISFKIFNWEQWKKHRSQTQEQHYLCPFTWTSRTGRGLPGGSVQETQEMWVPTLGWEDPLEEEMATHSSILAWKILQTEDIGGLQSIGSQRAGHNWAHMSP